MHRLQAAANALPVFACRYAFGTGTQVLPIPELMPFRLTRQMTGVLAPHDALAVLAGPMAAAFAALRGGADILEVRLDCMVSCKSSQPLLLLWHLAQCAVPSLTSRLASTRALRVEHVHVVCTVDPPIFGMLTSWLNARVLLHFIDWSRRMSAGRAGRVLARAAAGMAEGGAHAKHRGRRAYGPQG